MSDNIIKKVEKSDLDNVRQLIENEMILKDGEQTLNLTEIFQEGNNKGIKNKKINDKEILKKLIRNQIQDILRKELKLWFDNSLPLIIEPFIKEYLIASGSNRTSYLNQKENKNTKMVEKDNSTKELKRKPKNVSKESQKKVNKNISQDSNSKSLEKMTKVELQILGKKYDVIIDRRQNKEKIISKLKNVIS